MRSSEYIQELLCNENPDILVLLRTLVVSRQYVFFLNDLDYCRKYLSSGDKFNLLWLVTVRANMYDFGEMTKQLTRRMQNTFIYITCVLKRGRSLFGIPNCCFINKKCNINDMIQTIIMMKITVLQTIFVCRNDWFWFCVIFVFHFIGSPANGGNKEHIHTSVFSPRSMYWKCA